ncbi:MAG: SURF1 family protein [Legionellales bacterium]
MSYHYQFKPKLIPSVAFLLLFPFLLSLGFWQLGRMEEKQDILDSMASANVAQAMELSANSEPLDYSKAKVRGKFLYEFSVLLEHQMHNQQVGYHVLTPLVISDDLPWLWVNRGWIPVNEVLIPREQYRQAFNLTGLVYYPSENRFILGENFSKTSDGQVKIQRMDFKGLEQAFKHKFYPYVLLLDPASAQGFVRNWEIKTLPPSKHLGYAVQWFGLAGALFCIYIIVNLKRKDKK